MPGMSGAMGTGSAMSTPNTNTNTPPATAPVAQKGGFFLTEDGSLSWGSIIYSIIHFVLAWFAIYLVYTESGGIPSYLLACCCPYLYIAYHYGKNLIGPGKGQAGQTGAKVGKVGKGK